MSAVSTNVSDSASKRDSARERDSASERLDALAHSVSSQDADLGREIAAATERCFAGVRVQISGRIGVGKSSVRAALAAHQALRVADVSIVEAASIDVPRSPDPVLDGDVVVHVLASGAQPADIAVVRSSPDVVAVLAKADTIDGLGDVVRRLSAAVGTTVFPLMGTVAAAAAGGRPATFDPLRHVVDSVTADMLLTPERFVAADIRLTRRVRAELVESIETRGVGLVLGALRANPSTDDATLRLMLTDKSGVDPLAQAVRAAVDAVRVDRRGRLLQRVTEWAAQYPRIAEFELYLASDEAVLAIMHSALRALGEPLDPEPSLATVQLWRDRWHGASAPGHARAALAVTRGYLRLWTR